MIINGSLSPLRQFVAYHENKKIKIKSSYYTKFKLTFFILAYVCEMRKKIFSTKIHQV